MVQPRSWVSFRAVPPPSRTFAEMLWVVVMLRRLRKDVQEKSAKLEAVDVHLDSSNLGVSSCCFECWLSCL